MLSLKTRFFNSFRRLLVNQRIDSILRELTSHNPPNSFFGKIVPSNYLYPSLSFRTFIRKGIIYEYDISDFVNHYAYFGFRDESMENFISELSKGDVVFDVGANNGYISSLFSKAVGNDGKVISLEPLEINYKVCFKTVMRNNLDNINLIKCAVGNTDGLTRIRRYSNVNSGMSGIDESENDDSEEVPIKKLDSIFSELSLPRIDAIKIDVEGYELHVLNGASQVIQNFNPKLFIEIDESNLNRFGASTKMVCEFLNDHNYKVIDPRSKKLFNTNKIEHSDIMAIYSLGK